MKRISIMLAAAGIFIGSTSFANAQRINCNHDPVCQAKRDGRSVSESLRLDKAMTRCLRAVGYTQEDWHAYRVPAGPADKVRSCFAKNGIPS